MEIKVVDNRKLEQAYVEAPRRVYTNDPNWVPALDADMRKMIRPSNPFFKHAQVRHFVALDGKDVVGRIAATVYPAYNTLYKSRTGFFGFFESVNDLAVARGLLGAAESWLKEQQMDRISGPYNYCSTQEMGMLIEGFETPPALFQTHNPRYYPELLAQLGYTPEFHMTTYRWHLPEVMPLMESLLKRGDAITRRAGLVTRPFDKKRFWEEMALLLRLFNASFSNNSQVTQMEEDVYRTQVEALKYFIDERLITFIEKDGEPIAFNLLVPNLNEPLKKLNGKVGLLDLLRLGAMKRSVRSVVILLIGAVPKVHGDGVGRALVSGIIRSLRSAPQYQEVHTTWIHEGNWSSRALAKQWRATPTKRFAIVGRPLL
jgi:hypothetical protein